MTLSGAAQFIANKLNLGREAFYRNRPCEIDGQEGCRLISNAIENGKPQMIARLGAVESSVLQNFYEIQSWKGAVHNKFKRPVYISRNFRHEWDPNVCSRLCSNAGFFPNDFKFIEKFCEHFMKCMADCDVAGCFPKLVPGETFLWKTTAPTAKLILSQALEPYHFDKPWSFALAGKRVLVVHPFAKSIEQQYQNQRLKLFKNPSVLPEFTLLTIPAVQAIRQERTAFNDWFEALEYMQNKILAANFDVCIIGAGAFGLPLASYVKSLGKISIQMGGATQILFGIRGSRWERFIPEVAKHFNEHWVRPLASEHPKDYANLEGGAYW